MAIDISDIKNNVMVCDVFDDGHEVHVEIEIMPKDAPLGAFEKHVLRYSSDAGSSRSQGANPLGKISDDTILAILESEAGNEEFMQVLRKARVARGEPAYPLEYQDDTVYDKFEDIDYSASE